MSESVASELEGTARMGEALVKVHLVPVEVFGTECPTCETEFGYGLCDVAEPGSDCNRAFGHIYRRDDSDQRYRNPAEVITVFVPQSELPKFDQRFSS
ncbi:hypothetical protein [Actinomadura meridiana]|uniref:hypothetical protein n=1 Tax=Actinomadura meridiana TaxID=559626 RepID=UPI0031E98744